MEPFNKACAAQQKSPLLGVSERGIHTLSNTSNSVFQFKKLPLKTVAKGSKCCHGRTPKIPKAAFTHHCPIPRLSPSLLPWLLCPLGSGAQRHQSVPATDLMGREGSPASHQSFGGLMYMHHSSQLYPWAEFSYRCTSKVSCLMLSMDGRITRFRFSWIRERTGSALKQRSRNKVSLLSSPHLHGHRSPGDRK